VLERFGVKGVSLDNIEQLYNPHYSGIASMQATRTYLIKRGMTKDLADILAKRYINRLETSGGSIHSVMDFFSSTTSNASALNELLKSDLGNVALNY
jgi:hypothetical protein